MCGITGFLGTISGIDRAEVVGAMADALQHRGPDGGGVWVSSEDNVALGHRRLSILDLSDTGRQPMHSPSGRYVLVFNGELYNHLLLRGSIEKQCRSQITPWRGTSDTETLVSAFEILGIEETMKFAVGMFAFAVWDRLEKVLVLGRDRLGEKPLYYGWHQSSSESCFIFGSELKSLVRHPSFHKTIDRHALGLFIEYGYIPCPHTIYENTLKLAPGSLLYVYQDNRPHRIASYWSVLGSAQDSRDFYKRLSVPEIEAELETSLLQSVRGQMFADVPVGAFLSGGVDSTTITALMRLQTNRAVRTFSIGFEEYGYNEAPFAKSIAQHLETDHTELYVTSKDALRVIPDLASIYCEPFADSSQIPTILVSRLAREHVKVVLTGDGGDELFGGYNRYTLTERLWRTLSLLPQSSRVTLAQALRSLSPQFLNSLLGPLTFMLPRALRVTNIGQKIHKGAAVLPSENIAEVYRRLTGHWNPGDIVLGYSDSVKALDWDADLLGGFTNIEKMMVFDLLEYLPDDILVKVDRASMSTSLECRAPFLDHRVVELSLRIPQELKIRDGRGKWILRRILDKHVPRKLIERPKMGFGVPIEDWLRGALRPWAEALLGEHRLRSEGYFDAKKVREKWSEHLSGKRNWHHSLWNVLMFQAWLETHESR